MIDLNCKAAVAMTQITLHFYETWCACFADLFDRGISAVSISECLCGNEKHFLYRYSRALRVELYGAGIRVTAVCPYWIKDTGVHRAGKEEQ